MGQTLKNKVTFITGAGKGIGKAVAIALANEGVNIGLLARTEADLKVVASKMEGLEVKVAYKAVDVSSHGEVEQAIKTLTG